MLAALACLLAKEGRRVVYLPDYRGLLRNPFWYLCSALKLAFANDEKSLHYLGESETTDELGAFCRRACPDSSCSSSWTKRMRSTTRQTDPMTDTAMARKGMPALSSKISAGHLKVSSSSANYQGAKGDELRQAQEGANGGLRRAERGMSFRTLGVQDIGDGID